MARMVAPDARSSRILCPNTVEISQSGSGPRAGDLRALLMKAPWSEERDERIRDCLRMIDRLLILEPTSLGRPNCQGKRKLSVADKSEGPGQGLRTAIPVNRRGPTLRETLPCAPVRAAARARSWFWRAWPPAETTPREIDQCAATLRWHEIAGFQRGPHSLTR